MTTTLEQRQAVDRLKRKLAEKGNAAVPLDLAVRALVNNLQAFAAASIEQRGPLLDAIHGAYDAFNRAVAHDVAAGFKALAAENAALANDLARIDAMRERDARMTAEDDALAREALLHEWFPDESGVPAAHLYKSQQLRASDVQNAPAYADAARLRVTMGVRPPESLEQNKSIRLEAMTAAELAAYVYGDQPRLPVGAKPYPGTMLGDLIDKL